MNPWSFSVLQTILFAGFALVLSGCEVGPDYQAPENTIPPHWASVPESDAKAAMEYGIVDDILKPREDRVSFMG